MFLKLMYQTFKHRKMVKLHVVYEALVDFDSEIFKIIDTVSESKEGDFRDSLSYLKTCSYGSHIGFTATGFNKSTRYRRAPMTELYNDNTMLLRTVITMMVFNTKEPKMPNKLLKVGKIDELSASEREI